MSERARSRKEGGKEEISQLGDLTSSPTGEPAADAPPTMTSCLTPNVSGIMHSGSVCERKAKGRSGVSNGEQKKGERRTRDAPPGSPRR